MYCTIYNYYTNSIKYLRIHFLLSVFTMPFYAVANGRVPGIYKTWEECQSQTKGYPQAKYKKFNTENEASEYIRKTGLSTSSVLSGDFLKPSTSMAVENLNPPELKALGKYSSQPLLKQDKLSMISEKLDDFIEKTNNRLNEFSKRLDQLESFSIKESAEGKRKTYQGSEPEGFYEPKKKKLLDADDTLNDDSMRKSTRSQSNLTNGSVEEVDYPWGSGNNTSSDGFIIGPDGFTIVYTDGACTNNGKRGAKAGVGVWFNHNNPFNVAAPVEGNATNNNAEIQAATRAIDQATLAGIRRLNIHTDSQFMINCITDWIKKWKKNNWMTSAGGPVKNKEQLVLLDRAIQGMDAVKWTHVRGHMGNEGNECADALAVQGATMYKSN